MALIDVQTIEDFDAFLAERREVREAQDLLTVPWQSALGPGAKFVQFISVGDETLTIYGEILKHLEEPMPVELTAEDRAERAWEAQQWASPAMRHVRFARCYSTVCPDGELGHVHVSTFLGHLSDAEFEQAKAAGWPHYSAVLPE